MLTINYVNEYDDSEDYFSVIEKVLNTAYESLDLKEDKVISIILVNDDTIHEMNSYYRHIDRATDVLSFENLDDEGELGDVFISIDKTKAQAKDYGHSFDRELAFLSVHGFLHCNGYDHLNEEDEKEMFFLQDEILKKAMFER